MKKKVNVFGKSIPVLAIFVLGIALVSAALVPYLSNVITGNVVVDSPMSIEVTSNTGGSHDANSFTVALHGGESFDLTTITKNLANVPVENVLVEVMVPIFDGVGITYGHSDTTWTGNIPVCTSGDNAYYYIGPAGGFTAPVGYDMTATSTITADLALEPRTYTATIQVIKASDKVVDCVPLP